MRNIKIIEVRSEIGAGTRGASLGVDAIKVAALDFMSSLFVNIPTEVIPDENKLLYEPVESPYAKRIKGVYTMYERISQSVNETLKSGLFPIILAGDHSTAGGTIAGIKMAKSVAAVLAIRGNNDREPWAKKIPDILHLHINGVCLFIIHNVNDVEVDPAAKGFHAVISGHSHKPSLTNRDGVIFLNPGSAGPRRFKLPVALARLRIQREKVNAQIVELL